MLHHPPGPLDSPTASFLNEFARAYRSPGFEAARFAQRAAELCGGRRAEALHLVAAGLRLAQQSGRA